ncbi:MAG: hypothetical protein IJ194_07330, partial [Bacilli bacterium]|nr:hypothetical protein [Bacilli bacterium]
GLGFASPFFPRLGRPSKVGFGYVGFLYKATHRGLSPQACDVPVTQKDLNKGLKKFEKILAK